MADKDSAIVQKSTSQSDWGEEPILFGSLDSGAIALIGSIAAMVGFSLLGPIGGIAIAAAAGNDLVWALRGRKNKPLLLAPGGDEHPVDHGETVRKSLPAAAAPSSMRPETQNLSLIQQLEKDCPVLVQLIRSPPLRVVGAQRSGKTSFARILALVRQVAIDGHEAIAISPDHEPKGWPESFAVTGFDGGSGQDFGAAIAGEWEHLQHRCSAGGAGAGPGRTTIWDEFARIDEFVDAGDLTKTVKSLLCAASKNQEFPIFVCHGEQANFGLPGVENFVTSFLARTVRVECFGKMVRGGDGLPTMTPTGQFQVTGLDRSIASGSLPDWLTEDYLSSLLPPPAAKLHPPSPAFPTASPTPAPPPAPAPTPAARGGGVGEITMNQIRDRLNIYIEKTAASPEVDLSDREQAIVRYLQKHQIPATRRDIQRASIPQLKGLSAHEVESILRSLANTGHLRSSNGIYWV